RDHGGGALLGGAEAFLHGETRLVGLVLADLPAADAGDVAAQGGLEHDHERVAVVLLLRRHVAPDLHRAAKRKLHTPPFPLRLRAAATARASAGSTGPARYPSSRSAFSEEKYIGKRANRTSSRFTSPAPAAATATAYGTRQRGRERPARSAIA